MVDVVAHIKAAVAAGGADVDEEVVEYVSGTVQELLEEGDADRTADEKVEELVDAVGPMLEEFLDGAAVNSLIAGAVAHFTGADKQPTSGSGGG